MKTKHNLKSVISLLIVCMMIIGMVPTAFAAQDNEYVDPADSWVVANGRTNELDMNATTTYETQYCFSCGKHTTVLTYRVPEYTRSGETAANRGVTFSDGYDLEGKKKYNLDDGTPGVDAKFTGYHWTKTVCNACGTLNPADGTEAYNYNKNVYGLNPCDHNFFVDFDNTEYTPYSSTQHYVYLKEGEYCAYCKGTYAQAVLGRASHNFTEKIDAQIANNRFYVAETCKDCGYETSEYVVAKSVVTSYYGEADGEAHTVEVADLSESDVTTRIRYGTEAGKCNRTSAPNFTQAGYHTVYYEIDYIYGGETMTENGVGYVWLLDNNSNNSNNGTIIVLPTAHEHDYHYLETVAPSCDSLGYDRFQCNGCGDLIKTNYVKATGHNYGEVVIREATCKKNGVKLHMCKSCGDFYEESTPLAEHDYEKHTHDATCKSVGYDEYICKVCGDNHINNIKPMIDHKYRTLTKKATCTEKGYTNYICEMCNSSYVDDYVDALGHDWDEGRVVTNSGCTSEGVKEHLCKNAGCTEKLIIATDANGHTPGDEATCTTPQLCEVCGTVLENAHGHHYETETVKPTCTAMGYTVYTCEHCGDTYNSDYTDKAEHDYKSVVTKPTCTSHGYTTYSCKNCDSEYVSDYTEKLSHNYNSVVTAPTCTSMGYTTYTCEDCGDTHIGDYTNMTEHNYSKKVIEPTCTEHGYAVYTCPDCGKSYIGDYTDHKKHTYSETVIAPTCTEMGYTIFKCNDCDDEYKGNYTDKIPHDYEKTVTEPTCLDLGYTTFTCSACSDTYKGEYKEAKGHSPSEWIIDVPATIETAGEKHIECLICGTVLSRAAISQLVGKDRTDEDGNAKIGDYSILITDSKGKPIFDSEIVIDINDNVTIKLPTGRLLDYSDQTIITAIYTDTQTPKSELAIFISDHNGNSATGKTDKNGQLRVPNDKSSTGDDNGTIGNEENKVKNTFVVTVTDKTNVVIPNCNIRIGESNQIVVDLPEGVKPTRENPVIVTVTDQNGNAQKDITVIAMGDADFIEKGKTDIYGKITLPTASEGYTDNDGKVNVDNINVIVNDEIGVIANAYVKHNDDNTITVTLPNEKFIGYDNRVTVTVLDIIGKAIENISVTVNDTAEKSYTDTTDENGQIVVPPLSEDMTDSEGKAKVNGYNVLITDETKPIENAFVTIGEGQINVMLPDGVLIDINNRITATVTDSEDKAVKDMTVIFTDKAETTESNVTDENGRATVPPTNIDITDFNGYSEVDRYIVTVKNETAPIEKAYIKHTPEMLNEDGTVKENENISITLPDNVSFSYADRITVTVAKKTDNTAVCDMQINISEFAVEGVETKSLTDKTDKNGIAVFPPLNEDITDNDGNSNIKDDKTDENGETTDVVYNVMVEDTKGKIENALVEVKDGKISVKLPDTHTLTTSNQTTVTVTDKDNMPMANVSVTITDATTSKTGTTNSNGKVILPVKSTGGGGGSSSGGSSGGGGGSSISNTVNVKVVDKDGKTVSVSKSTGTDKVTLTLPNGKNLAKGDNYYTITVTDRSNKAKADYTVVLKDKNGNEVSGTTDKNGVVTLPGKTHTAYIFGYDDGTFRPNSNMTRAEAAAIFARLVSEQKGEKISGKTSFKDISANDWFAKEVGYLEKYGIIKGYNDNTFKPDESVTRAEFVAMTVRFNALFNDVEKKSYTVNYTDVASSYWAYSDIAYAKNIGWLNGYADGTFKGDNAITRAEVVTVVNRATGRNADSDYITKNYTKLNRFTDVTDSGMWYFFDIAESANTHKGITNGNSETWVE